MLAELAVRNLGPEWKQKVAERPGGALRPGGTIARIGRAPGRVGDLIFRRADRDRVVDGIVFAQLVRLDVAGVQKAEMRGVDIALQRLQIIAVALNEHRSDL